MNPMHSSRWSPNARAIFATTAMAVVSLVALGLRRVNDTAQEKREAFAARLPHPSRPAPREWHEDQRRAELIRELHDSLMTASPLERQRALLRMLDGMEARDFPLAMEAMRGERMVAGGYNDLAFTLLRAWAAVDGPAAVRWERSSPHKAGLGGFAPPVWVALGEWQTRDAAGLKQWLASLPPDEAKIYQGPLNITPHPQAGDAHAAEQAAQLSTQPPDAAWAAVKDLPEAERAQALRDVARTHFDSGKFGTLQQWIHTIPEGEERNRVVLSLLNQPGGPGLRDKLSIYSMNTWLVGRVDLGPVYDWMIHRESESMLAVLENLPGTPEMRAETMRWVIRGLDGDYDPARAVELMDRHPEAATDELITGWMDQAASGEGGRPWELILSAAGKIKDPTLREKQYQKVLEKWRRKDAGAAARWEESHR